MPDSWLGPADRKNRSFAQINGNLKRPVRNFTLPLLSQPEHGSNCRSKVHDLFIGNSAKRMVKCPALNSSTHYIELTVKLN